MSQSLYFVNLKIPCSIHMNVYFPFLHTSSSDLPLTRNVGVISAFFLSSLAPFNFVDSIPIIIYNVIASFPFLPFPRIQKLSTPYNAPYVVCVCVCFFISSLFFLLKAFAFLHANFFKSTWSNAESSALHLELLQFSPKLSMQPPLTQSPAAQPFCRV